jgi:hypothetical protein
VRNRSLTYGGSVTDNPRVPTEADEARFWTLIELAWARLNDDAQVARRTVTMRDPEDEDVNVYAADPFLENLLVNLAHACADMSGEELIDLDRVLERKLFDIDRADIQAVTDGSDDGFLYCRGFIVALGRDFYEAVKANPAMAVLDGECEGMCYLFARLYDERYGGYPDTGSGISRESVSNADGWRG